MLEKPPSELQGQSMRRKRSRMRKRIKSGLTDFDLLYKELGEDDFNLILGLEPQSNDGSGDPGSDLSGELHEELVSIMAFLYEATERLGWDFEYFVREGVEQYCMNSRDRTRQTVDAVDVDVKTSESPLDKQTRTFEKAKRKYERGDVLNLTDHEFRVLAEWTDLSSDDFLEEYREKREEQRREESIEEAMKRMSERVDALGGDRDDE